jgi:hypothetical protein
MSWWTKIRNGLEFGALAAGGAIVGGPAGAAAGAAIALGTNKSSRKDLGLNFGEDKDMNLINDQIKAYKDQTELSRAELNKTRNEQAIEKRRIQEKQIRSLRRNYRSTGILGTVQTTPPDMSDKLGG